MDIENEGPQVELEQTRVEVEEPRVEVEEPRVEVEETPVEPEQTVTDTKVAKSKPKHSNRNPTVYERISLPIPNYTPSGIEHIAYDAKSNLIAIARSNSTFEVWNYVDWTLLATFPLFKQCQVRRIAFLNNLAKPILVVATTNCMLYLYNLEKSQPFHSKTLSGNAIWDMKVNEHNEIALAFDDGTVKIHSYDADDEELLLERAFKPYPEKALSVAWDPEANFLYAGFQNGKVRKYDRKTGGVLFTINLKSTEIVWALQSLPAGGILVMGTSEGNVHFYETKHGTMISEIKTHEADVLCVEVNSAVSKTGAVAEDETVYATGADSRIVALQCVTEDGEMGESVISKWIQTSSDRGQSHDVKALCLILPKKELLAGGLTTDVCIYKLEKGNFRNRKQLTTKNGEKKHGDDIKLRHIGALPMRKLISIAGDKNLYLYQFDYSLELWEFSYEDNEYNLLIELKTKDLPITASFINKAGSLLAYSTIEETHVFTLNTKDYRMQKSATLKASSCLTIHPSSAILYRVDYETNAFERIEIQTSSSDKPLKSVTSVALEEPGVYSDIEISQSREVVAFGSKITNQIYYSHGDVKKTKKVSAVPQFFKDSAYTSFRISQQNDLLLITFANNKFCFFNMNEGVFTKWSRENIDYLPQNYLKRYNKIIGAVFDRSNSSNLVLYTHYYMIKIHLNEKIPRTAALVKDGKTINRKPVEGEEHTRPSNFEITYFDNPTLLLDFINSNQLVSVSANWREISARFPYAINAKKYGL